MNILLTSHRFHPDIGGIESITELLGRHFSATGHAVRLITQSHGHRNNDLTFPFSIYRRPSLLQLLRCYRWADVVLQNNLEVRQLWPLLVSRKPLVIGLQTWIRSVTGERGLVQRLKLLALQASDQLIACSNAVRLDSNPRATVIHNPYNSSLFRVLPGVPRLQSIAFLGRLVSDKGAEMLLRAFAALQPVGWRLSVIGDGPERSASEHLAAELGITDSVDFLGPLQGENLVHILNQHEVLVVPSRWREPFGIVVLEGMACGCVVLASDGGGLPEAVGPSGLLFRRDDQADLNTRLGQLLQDCALREHLRDSASAHLEPFQQQLVCNRYLSVLETVYQRAR